ncbi:MAG: ribosomal-processing cysteine protease Prp [Synergistaceae bacterium]|nr:ribosomal-processing cysteine protease Prp [Synergistaceae bacterium]
MTDITLFYQGKKLIGIESKGHSDYAESNDVICAAVSVLMQSLVFGLSEIARVPNLFINMDDSVPLIKITWQKKQFEKVSLLVQTVAESLKIIAADNSDYVKIHTEEI